MHFQLKYKTWKVDSSSDGKRHFLTSQECPIVIEIDTDDYTNETFPTIKQLVYVLGDHWKP